MVGDFVVNTEFGKNKIDKIETLEPRRVWLEHGKTYVPIEFIAPIPLTKEILEKNGFKFGLYGECFFCTLSTSTIKLFKFHGDIWWYHGIKIEKVHELQHVIRLCGIKKEIEL